MTPDPLATMLARALGQSVSDARSEPLGTHDGVEVERVRFTSADGERTLTFERFAPRHALEAQLLPFLARKSDRVPVVHARGIPHSLTPAPPWVLVEDLTTAPGACDGDPRAVVDAKIAIDHAIANDGPALRALGVPERLPGTIAEEIAAAAPDAAEEARESARRLAKQPRGLVHASLTCAAAAGTARGVVIRRWGRAYLGCTLLDVVRLTRDLVARDDAVRGIGLSRYWSEQLGIVLPTEVLRAAEKLDAFMSRYLDW